MEISPRTLPSATGRIVRAALFSALSLSSGSMPPSTTMSNLATREATFRRVALGRPSATAGQPLKTACTFASVFGGTVSLRTRDKASFGSVSDGDESAAGAPSSSPPAPASALASLPMDSPPRRATEPLIAIRAARLRICLAFCRVPQCGTGQTFPSLANLHSPE